VAAEDLNLDALACLATLAAFIQARSPRPARSQGNRGHRPPA